MAVDSERLLKASAAAIKMFCKGKNNQTKEYSVICTLNEDAVEKGGDHKRGSPKTYSAGLKKDLSSVKGGGYGGKQEGGKSFNLFLKREKN